MRATRIGPKGTQNLDFREVFEAYFPTVVRHVVYLTGNRTSAEDIAQEVFLKFFKNPPHDFANLRAWLLKVATNTAFNNIKSEARRRKREECDASERSSIDDSVERFSEVEAARAALNRIPERDRLCLLLRFSGYAYAEIADMLGMRKSSVGTSIARAQERFRAAFMKGENRR